MFIDSIIYYKHPTPSGSHKTLSIVFYKHITPSECKLQTQFANLVEKTEALKEQYKNSLQELENLYGSLSQKAFKGELEIKDPERVIRL